MGQNRLAVGLSFSALLSCLFVGGLISHAPMMSNGRQPSLVETAAMIAVPALASVVATWAASRNRPVILSIATLVVGLFVVVTGFSIGTAFLPAVGLLIWAITASVANGPAEQQSS